VWRFPGNGAIRAPVLSFQMPTLPAGHTISTANLDLYHYYGSAGYPHEGDLYGVRTAAADTVFAADFYAGELDTSATLLQDAFVTSVWPDPTELWEETDAGGDAALAAYLTANYSAGDWVFLRLSPNLGNIADYSATALYRYRDDTNVNNPVLTIETIPEPATLGLLGLAGLGAMIARRLRIS